MTDDDEVQARFTAAVSKYWWRMAWKFARTTEWKDETFFPHDFKRKLPAALKCLADRDSVSARRKG